MNTQGVPQAQQVMDTVNTAYRTAIYVGLGLDAALQFTGLLMAVLGPSIKKRVMIYHGVALDIIPQNGRSALSVSF